MREAKIDFREAQQNDLTCLKFCAIIQKNRLRPFRPKVILYSYGLLGRVRLETVLPSVFEKGISWIGLWVFLCRPLFLSEKEVVFCLSVYIQHSLREGDDEMPGFTHFDGDGNAVMVDIGEKAETQREAVAEGKITMSAECYEAVKGGGIKKGDVLGVARLAGIMALKQTASLIPLCHILPIEKASVDFYMDDKKCEITARCIVKVTGKTGVEMEALVGASAALLTIYDMCKAVDKSMTIDGICLIEKQGGKSGIYRRDNS